MFYPPAGERPRGRGRFDELRFYAEHFDTVEVNSSFYRIPSQQTTASWARRTPEGFEFALKLFQKFTHPEMFHKATGADPLDLDTTDVDEFRAAVEPLASAGKLGPLLAQFPASFKDEPGNRGYLEWLLDQFRDYQLAVELRHASWSDAAGDIATMLRQFGAAWTQIDEPKFKGSIRQTLLPNVKTFYYLRLHGRNAAQWWKHDHSEDRYNYLYSAEELEPFADAVKEATRREVKKAYLYANNHFSAKSVANAALLKHQVGQPVPGDYTEEMVKRYPDLKGVVKVLGSSSRRPTASRKPS